MKSIKRVLGCLRKADNDYHLINDGDRICVGLSGGKDSSVLLYCLYLYQKFSKKQYDLMAIYCDLGFGNKGIDEIIEFFRDYDIPIYKQETDIAEILKLHKTSDDRLDCSLCAKLRKGAIINMAKQYGCNKLAFAHHHDDAAETLFMNMIHGGKIATFQPETYLERMDIHLIRPLIYTFEKDIIKAREYLNIPVSKNLCGNDGVTERQNMKELLGSIYHKYPQARDNFELMLRNDKQLALFKPDNQENEK